MTSIAHRPEQPVEARAGPTGRRKQFRELHTVGCCSEQLDQIQHPAGGFDRLERRRRVAHVVHRQERQFMIPTVSPGYTLPLGDLPRPSEIH